jgi:pimeloyl-ACP methyl ester carboxylesterase
LLFVHGWAIDRTYWSSQVEAFCPDYHVVTMDLPGHGESGKNRDSWTVADYAGDVEAVIDQLQLQHVVLIGHSMGGDIILEAAIDNDKVIALVGVDNFKDVGAEYDDEVKARISGFIDQLRTSFDATAVAYSRRSLFQPTTDSTVVRRVIRSELNADSTIAATTLEELFEYTPREADRLSQLNKQLYLINSSATPTDSVGLRSTGVSFEVLDVGPTGHYPMVEDPEGFNELLRQVLAAIEDGARR